MMKRFFSALEEPLIPFALYSHALLAAPMRVPSPHSFEDKPAEEGRKVEGEGKAESMTEAKIESDAQEDHGGGEVKARGTSDGVGVHTPRKLSVACVRETMHVHVRV